MCINMMKELEISSEKENPDCIWEETVGADLWNTHVFKQVERRGQQGAEFISEDNLVEKSKKFIKGMEYFV